MPDRLVELMMCSVFTIQLTSHCFVRVKEGKTCSQVVLCNCYCLDNRRRGVQHATALFTDKDSLYAHSVLLSIVEYKPDVNYTSNVSEVGSAGGSTL